MLLIWQGTRFPIQTILASKGMVWFGRISYSTYLIHWPIIVFWLYLSIDPPSPTQKVLLLALSILGGALLDSLVAQRFRYARGSHPSVWRFPATQIGLIVLVAMFCAVAMLTNGIPSRFALVPRVAEYRDENVFPFLRDYGDGVVHIAGKGAGKVLIFGDSMAQNYVPAILGLDGIQNAEIDIVSRGGCVLAKDAVLVNFGSQDEDCLALRDRLYRVDERYDLVIWSQNWLGYASSLHWHGADGSLKRAFSEGVTFSGWSDAIDRTIDYFAMRARKVVVIGPQVSVDNVNPIIRRIGPVTNIARIAAGFAAMRESSEDSRGPIEKGIRALVTGKNDTLYIDPRSIICGERQCRLSNGDVSYYLDSLHNTSAAIPALRSGLERAGLRL
jgi:hypothetical protein